MHIYKCIQSTKHRYKWNLNDSTHCLFSCNIWYCSVSSCRHCRTRRCRVFEVAISIEWCREDIYIHTHTGRELDFHRCYLYKRRNGKKREASFVWLELVPKDVVLIVTERNWNRNPFKIYEWITVFFMYVTATIIRRIYIGWLAILLYSYILDHGRSRQCHHIYWNTHTMAAEVSRK